MKRKSEESEAPVTFFQLEEATEILLRHAPLARLLAGLLQLCKRQRRRVWDFLSDPTKWDAEWLANLCHDLFHYRKRHGYAMLSFRAMDPVFVRGATGYGLCRFLDKDTLLWATVYHFAEDGSFPGWEAISMPPPVAPLFDWYFVGRALVLAWDTRVLRHSRHCWHDERVVWRDADLCLL